MTESVQYITNTQGERIGVLLNMETYQQLTNLSCYTAKLYNPNILNSCGTGILPVPLIQIKCTTAYQQIQNY
ncbi:hypothetical protein PN497_08470 [Sphaerospermopsis kisseleviana CS-549]|uniref:Uncharacterized protein n=1 Tax=Sphaerospermopsis kisseleviana CS-549 TaxID=3021783 RepID=A0ABT4ZPQ9_9CYAN|nr:hypothetical protein [Sphaerospermopsis kisseleviana]MDB9441391.1 hypothetical protein [Sphaerospermopsis kisseleviana CS-549]BAZ79252.1 hypothetical protein NIES73_04930 [Sphaerospermopsis kisseleviana NIES-73]